MPDQQIEFGGEIHSFPDSFSDEDIRKALASEKPHTYVQKLVSNIPESAKRVFQGTVSAYKPTGFDPGPTFGRDPGADPQETGFQQDWRHIKEIGSKLVNLPTTVQQDPVGSLATAGRLASGVVGGIGESTAGRVGSVVKGAAKGAWEEGMAPSPLYWHGVRASLPSFVTSALIPGVIGRMTAGEEGAAVGAGAGAAYPFLKGAYQGGKAAFRDLPKGEPSPFGGGFSAPVTPPPSPSPTPQTPKTVTPIKSPKLLEAPKTTVTEPPPGHEAFLTESEASPNPIQETQNRARLAQGVGKYLNAQGMTADAIRQMSPEDQATFWAHHDRVTAPHYSANKLVKSGQRSYTSSPETRTAILEHMEGLEANRYHGLGQE